jgi:glycosyltransferase involved in cell wall biosynthesis
MSETATDLTIVVPAYNEEKYIGACLEAILKECANTTLKVEVIVIDNNSTDDTARVTQSFPGVRLIHEPTKGLTAARRCGLENASAPLLANVDADTHMPEGWINRVYSEFQKNPKVVLVSGPYTYYDVPWYTTALVWMWWNVFAYPTYLIIGHMAVGGNFALRTQVMKPSPFMAKTPTSRADSTQKERFVLYAHSSCPHQAADLMATVSFLQATYTYLIFFQSYCLKSRLQRSIEMCGNVKIL